MSDELKQQWWDERPTEIEVVTSNAQGVSRSRRPLRRPAAVAWPDYLPPYLYHSLTSPQPVRFTPDGRLWVQRAVAAHDLPLVDVIDRSGRLVQRIRLPRTRRLVGFGAGTVYLVRQDHVDLQYLERYALPTHRQ